MLQISCKLQSRTIYFCCLHINLCKVNIRRQVGQIQFLRQLGKLYTLHAFISFFSNEVLPA